MDAYLIIWWIQDSAHFILLMPARNQSDTRSDPGDKFDDEFHRLLGRMVHAVARLDFVVGLQVRYWGREDDPRIKSLLKPRKAKLKERLSALEALIMKSAAHISEEGIGELRLWFERAHSTRVIRNDYAHGRWAVPGGFRGSESRPQWEGIPVLHFVPLSWEMSPEKQKKPIEMTLDEFSEEVSEAERLVGGFIKLTDRYAGQAYPGQNLVAP